MQFFAFFSPKWYIFPQYSFNKMSNVILDLDSIWVSIFTLTVISLFSKEITVHIFWGHLEGQNIWRSTCRHQICERVEVYLLSNINFLHDQKIRYLLFTLNFNLNVCCHISCPFNKGFVRLDPGLWEIAN